MANLNDGVSPHWPTIREAAERGPLSEYALRKGIRDGWVPGIFVGNRFRVNYEKLLEILEAKSMNGIEANTRKKGL